MTSFFLLGAALYGTMLPWSVRLLLLVGGLAPLTGIRVRAQVRPSAGAAYPYPPQQRFSGGASRRPGDDDPYGSP